MGMWNLIKYWELTTIYIYPQIIYGNSTAMFRRHLVLTKLAQQKMIMNRILGRLTRHKT